MLIGKKIRIKTTPELEILFRKCVGVARFSYNLMISLNNSSQKFIKESDVRKYVTQLKKQDNYSWLKEVSANIPKQAIKNCGKAYSDYFKKLRGKPKFKKKFKNDRFYVSYESLKKTNLGFKAEKLGEIRTSEPLPEAKQYYNPYIIYDNKYWYLTFSIETECIKEQLNDFTLGIDLGIKHFVVTSQNEIISNINKTLTMKKLYKKIKRYQRKLTKCLKNSFNRIKVLKQLRRLFRRQKNIRNNHIHQATSHLVKTKPSKIVVEYLRVSNILKNKRLSKAISESGFYEFRRQLEYKCKLRNIKFMLADTFFPSSKKCSNCGNIKKDLTLKDRIYKCDCCGLEIDRDYNASLNLSKL